MRRIKVGKGLLRSLFPSSNKNKKKKASSSSKNKSSSEAGAASNNTPVNNGSSAFNCPTILGGGRRKVDERPYELHQEGASLPPSPGGEGRDHEHNFGGGGVGEKELQLTSPQQQQQQQGNDVKREANVITPITVAYSLSEEQDNELEEEGKAWNKMAITETIEVEVEATAEKQQEKDMEHCVPQQTQNKQGDESFDTALFDQNFPSSPSKDETRRRAIARQQRILSQASTRFQALSETATIDTSGFSYCSPPHLQRRRWQQHIGRQTKPQVVDDGNQQVSSSRGQSIIGLPPRQQQQQQQQQLPQAKKNYSSVVFYDSTPTRDLATSINNSSSSSSSGLRKHQEGQLSSPTCVADMMENFE
eukprot:scaffold11847_cov55-Skeletonema_dohrnii-CCMP3373.AAC.2